MHCNGVVEEKIRDKRKYDNTIETSLCLRGRCCAGDKNQTGPKNTLQKLKQEAEKYGLVINQNKTKYMRHSRTQTHGKDMEIETEGMKIEEVNNVKYLGTIVTKDNLIEEEIKERIAASNRAFFANKKIFQSKLISKKSKIKLYKALIRSVVVYGSEWWVLT